MHSSPSSPSSPPQPPQPPPLASVVEACIEVPLSAECVRCLRACVPPPVAASVPFGGPYRKRPRAEGGEGRQDCEEQCEALLRRRDEVASLFVACGWERIGPRRMAHPCSGRVHRLIWPWDWTDACESEAEGGGAERREGHSSSSSSPWMEVHVSGAPEPKRARRLCPIWRDVAMASFAHSSVAVRVFMSSSPRPRPVVDGADALDDFASRVTHPRRHATFASVRRPGVVLHSSASTRAPVSRFACLARMASSSRGAIARYFVPEDDDDPLASLPAPSHHGGCDPGGAAGGDGGGGRGGELRGFVASDPSVLVRPPRASDARNIAYADPPRHHSSSAHLLPRASPCDLSDAVLDMEEADVCEHLHLVASPPLPTPDALRAHGALPRATRLCWPARLAFLRCVADARGAAVHYSELTPGREGGGGGGECSAEMLTVHPSSSSSSPSVVALPSNARARGVHLLWDGRKWGVRVVL